MQGSNLQAEPQQTDARDLKLAQAVEWELKGGESHTYQVRLEAGQYLRAVVEQKGIDVVAMLYGPGGLKLLEVDSPNGPEGPELLLMIAKESGEYRLMVAALDVKAPPGRYAVKVEEVRTATTADTTLIERRIAIDGALAEAQRLRAQGTAESLHKTLEKYSEALQLLRAVEDPQREGTVLNLIGNVYLQLDENQKALEYHEQALRLRRAAGDRQGESRILSNIGNGYWQLGNSLKALEYYSQALLLKRALGDRRAEAITLGNIGSVYHSLGRLQEALDYYNQTLPILREFGNRKDEAIALNNIGVIYLKWGESQKALQHYNQALALQQALGDRRSEAATLGNIGTAYQQLGEYQKALDYQGRALPLRRSTGDRAGEVFTLDNIGVAYLSLGEPQKALEHYGQALSLSRDRGDRRGEAHALDNIGMVHRSLGDTHKALDLLNQSLPLRRTVGDRLGEALTLSHIGTTYISLGKPKEALDYLGQALSLQRAVGDQSNEAVTLRDIARAERDLGHLEVARSRMELALDIIERTRSQLFSQQLRATFSASRQGYYESYIDILMQMHRRQPSAGYDAVALQASERARARGLLEILTESHADIRQGVDAALLNRERSLQQQLSIRSERMTRLLGGKHTEEQEAIARKEVEALLAEYQEVEAQIREKSPRYAALTQPRPLSIAEIQKELDADTVLLEYALGEEHSYLWAVTQSSVTSFELPKRADIEAQTRRVYELLVTKADALYPKALAGLSQILLGPVAGQLGNKRLIVVADGALQYVPFGALPEPSPGIPLPKAGGNVTRGKYQPLVVEHEVVSLPSASTVAVLRIERSGRSTAPLKVIVLADPVFSKEDERVKAGSMSPPAVARGVEPNIAANTAAQSDVVRSAGDVGITYFDRLLVSRREAELITSLTPNGQSLKVVDFNASKAAVVNLELGRYQIVHFATHSILNNSHPELSGIVLSLVDERGQPIDGFLRLHEIYNLRLSADLVVLSACQTALGKEIRGEGLVGLTRGFMYAGAPRVVASLWNVSDRATAELMRRFYRNMLREGLPPAEALRAAQVSMSKERQWAAPYYWAGFVLQGEWR